MAYYAALVPLVQLLREISQNSLPETQQIHVCLYKKFNLVQDLLEHYSSKDYEEESIDLLESRIRDAACLAQDIIESHISNHMRSEDKPGGVKGISQHLIFPFRKTFRQLQPQRSEGPVKEYYKELEKVKEEVDSIVEELTRIKESNKTHKETLQLKSHISADGVEGASKIQSPTSGNSNTIFVFNEDLMTAIKGQLCGEPSRLEVISIVGMGGLGKTTLARKLFDDKIVHDCFDCRAWVTVSQNYHLRHILLAISDFLDMDNKEELKNAEERVLVECIYKHLFGRRYLIVVDDMWETRVWDDVKRMFPNDNNRSRVITTTRLSNVADYVDNFKFIHHLPFLDKDQSWNLFCQKVFCTPSLEDIGRLIAKACRGLPLAIVVVAGILSKVNQTQQDWEEILRHVSSVASQNDERFSRILALSYNHLPHHLKPCFLYIGGFPQDYIIHVPSLIRLWVSEGFIKSIASKSLEETGEEYFKDLVDRNLVLITKMTSTRKFQTCILHDLLRDLCTQRAHYENFLHCLPEKLDLHRELPVQNARRLYVHRLKGSLLLKYQKERVSHVRSIIQSTEVASQSDFVLVASGSRFLRVLHAKGMWSAKFPNVIEELVHLRYLALQLPRMFISPSIAKLQNLETFIIDCSNQRDDDISLPSEIWKMPRLRHIIIYRMILPGIPYDEIRAIDGVPLLRMLQTLSMVVDFRFTNDTIEMIPNLKMLEVEITRPNYITWKEFGLNNFIRLRQLETLNIVFRESGQHVVRLPKNVFPSTLVNLTLWGCTIPWKDMSVVGSLPSLQVLKLKNDAFVGEEWKTIEGEFPRLRFLQWNNLNEIKYWKAESNHFPCLEELYIFRCPKLKGISLGIGDITTLKLITVDIWQPSLKSSVLEIQEEQRDQGNEDLKIRIYCRVGL